MAKPPVVIQRISISANAIANGDCSGIPAVELRYEAEKAAEAVVYEIEAAAQSRYRFGTPPIVNKPGQPNANAVLHLDPNHERTALTVWIKNNPQNFDRVDFLLDFKAHDGGAQPPAFDPIIINRGPHT